eukprot:6459376-Amphidinium_carterae.1
MGDLSACPVWVTCKVGRYKLGHILLAKMFINKQHFRHSVLSHRERDPLPAHPPGKWQHIGNIHGLKGIVVTVCRACLL